jgi:hypothetical protein
MIENVRTLFHHQEWAVITLLEDNVAVELSSTRRADRFAEASEKEWI